MYRQPPAVALSQRTSVHLQDTYSAEVHEMQHLVEEEGSRTTVPADVTVHLDTKVINIIHLSVDNQM